ncbi:hypothetical protein F441_04804 [Phytophthora nicotianae CJ01A1]|uniref:SWIM-type domain-containing protein n=2 Tax=Phytophthora nicotianae TaxID=4792 RepID=W2XFS8_PHYNI|nr:hypothetical protein F441_04804 [Phytophthora nicotianae CJ01A1]
MPTTTKWTTVCSDMAREDSQLLIEDMKVIIIVKSQLVPCVVLTCQGLNRVTITETAAHETLVKEPQKVKLTPRLKDYGREMSELPTLRQVQLFVSSYSKKNLHRNDDYDEILSQIDQLAYGPTVSDTNPFLFGWKRDGRGKPDCQLVVKFVMADAEAAQQNAVIRVFGADCEFVYLMCFFHVMAKVHEKRKSVPDRLRDQAMADVYDLLFAASQDVYDEQVKTILTSWSDEEQMVWFRGYFERTCRDLLVDMTPSRSSIDFLLVSPNPDVVRVLSRGCERVYLPELGRSRAVGPVSAQMRVNYARMEVAGQPESGWNVDLSTNSCGYKYYFKFAVCSHVLFALQIKSYTGLDGKRTLVNRSMSRKRRRPSTTSVRVPAGRPLANQHALNME